MNLFLLGSLEITLIVIGAIILLIILWYIGVVNKLRQLDLKVDEAMSGIDVALTKRFDALTKLLDTTKGYAKHETETLEKVIKWRSGLPSNATLEDKQEFANQLNKVASGLNVVLEQYPDLKANTMFNNLQKAIMDTEEHLQASRRLYNSNVRILNEMIVRIPYSIVARNIGMKKRPFFEAEAAKREDVKMEF